MTSHARVLLLSLAAAGCGGTDPADSAPPPPPPPPPILSFTEITGTWEGTLTELRTANKYPITVRILGTVPKGETAGDIVYHMTAIGFNADCDARLLALSAAGQVYDFDERILSGPCVNNGMVVLTRDPATGTLRYEWYSSAGTKCCDAQLTRKST